MYHLNFSSISFIYTFIKQHNLFIYVKHTNHTLYIPDKLDTIDNLNLRLKEREGELLRARDTINKHCNETALCAQTTAEELVSTNAISDKQRLLLHFPRQNGTPDIYHCTREMRTRMNQSPPILHQISLS